MKSTHHLGRKNGKGADALEEREGCRRCLVCGEFKPKEDLIRFVLDPDNHIVPDLAENLPGHGYWLCADRETLATAIQKHLFDKAASCKTDTKEDLIDLTTALSLKRFLALLGLARGASLVRAGTVKVEECVRDGKAAYLIVAEDAGKDGLSKVAFGRVPVLIGPSREALSAALGRENAVYLAVKSNNLAEKVKKELERWHKLTSRASLLSEN